MISLANQRAKVTRHVEGFNVRITHAIFVNMWHFSGNIARSKMYQANEQPDTMQKKLICDVTKAAFTSISSCFDIAELQLRKKCIRHIQI